MFMFLIFIFILSLWWLWWTIFYYILGSVVKQNQNQTFYLLFSVSVSAVQSDHTESLHQSITPPWISKQTQSGNWDFGRCSFDLNASDAQLNFRSQTSCEVCPSLLSLMDRVPAGLITATNDSSDGHMDPLKWLIPDQPDPTRSV